MNTPMGFIGAMFEPCDSKPQALLASVCMLVAAAILSALAYGMYQFGHLSRVTSVTMSQTGERYTDGSMFEQILFGYGVAAIAAMLALLLVVCAIIAPIRTFFPKEFSKREDDLR